MSPDSETNGPNKKDLSLLEEILSDANRIVRLLRLPSNQHSLYDDVVQDTMIVVLRNIDMLRTFEPDRRRAWVYGTMFLVARNTQRSEFRRTAAWVRLRDAFHHETVGRYFDQAVDDQAERLLAALQLLDELDRQLLVGRIWAGFSVAELAKQHNLTTRVIYYRTNRARQTARNYFMKNILTSGENGALPDMYRGEQGEPSRAEPEGSDNPRNSM